MLPPEQVTWQRLQNPCLAALVLLTGLFFVTWVTLVRLLGATPGPIRSG